MRVPKRHNLVWYSLIRARLIRRSLLFLVGLSVMAVTACHAEPVGRSSSPSASQNAVVKGAANAATAEPDFLASLEAAGKGDAPKKEPSLGMTLVRFVMSLALVLALAYATILGLKRFTSMKTGVGHSGRRIRIVENSQLGPNRALHLVEIGGRKLLVASTPSQISLITEIEADQASTDGAGVSDIGPQTSDLAFRDQLAMFLGSKNDSEKVSRSVGQMLRESSTFIQDGITRIGSLRRRLSDA